MEPIERLYGKANRIWVLDRGMVFEENVRFLKEAKRRYIVGTPKCMLKRFERQLRAKDWIKCGRSGGAVLSRPWWRRSISSVPSAQRKEKEQAIHERFEKRIEEGLGRSSPAAKRKQLPPVVEQPSGDYWARTLVPPERLRSRSIQIQTALQSVTGKESIAGARGHNSVRVVMCYAATYGFEVKELWRAYMQLTEAEAAFRIQKTDLQLRPIWHQKQERVEAHILVCFLAFVLWKTLAQLCQRAGLGNEPRKVFQE